MILHAGCLALWTAGCWRAALVEGPSGSGKSDLALRALDMGLGLVADDRTVVWRSGGRLFGSCPPPLRGLLEARGLGLVTARGPPLAEIVLLVRCQGEPPERMPEPETAEVAGALLPMLRLQAFEASAPAKMRRALASLGAAA